MGEKKLEAKTNLWA